MDTKTIIDKTSVYVKNELVGEPTGHDWWHVYRVWKIAKNIAKKEKSNMLVVQLAALLHDIADWKFNSDDAGVRKARKWMNYLKIDKQIIDEVSDIIKNISFKGAGLKNRIKTKEGMIVQDADRLDAMGAIGIARTFAYGGYIKRAIYHPDIPPNVNQSSKQYKNNTNSTFNHFYEKLLLLKERMNTVTAKKIAKERYNFMKEFLNRFLKEWNGN